MVVPTSGYEMMSGYQQDCGDNIAKVEANYIRVIRLFAPHSMTAGQLKKQFDRLPTMYYDPNNLVWN